MKDLRYICAQPDDSYYTWQVHLWLESLRNRGESDKAIVLIFIPKFRERNEKWDHVIALYPEGEFVFYKDEDSVSDLLGIYIPIIRPYVLWKYFSEHPEMSSKAVFYCDSDVLFTEKFDIQQFIDDDINYLRLKRDKPMPFGPFIAAAGWIALIWGRDIIDIYTRSCAFG